MRLLPRSVGGNAAPADPLIRAPLISWTSCPDVRGERRRSGNQGAQSATEGRSSVITVLVVECCRRS